MGDQLPHHQHQVFEADDDGRLKRTGTVWTASAHMITAVIGSGVLSLAWATAQLGWIAGPAAMFLFSCVTYYTSTLLAACYRSGDPHTGGFQVKLCGCVQYLNLCGVAIGYTITSAISMVAIKRSNRFHENGHRCGFSSNTPYMITFGIVEIIFSQIPDFNQLWLLSIIAAVMSFTYSTIGIGLGIAKVKENGKIMGSMTGISTVTEAHKIWQSFQALGDIAFAYSYSLILIEIQDTLRSHPPSEYKKMKKASLISVGVTTLVNMLCGYMGYAAFGDDMSPQDNLLSGFGFHNYFWVLDIANAAIVIHIFVAYQLHCQPLFTFIEKQAANRYPNCGSITKEILVPIFHHQPFKLNLFRLVWRTIFVIVTTIISIFLPSPNNIIGLLGAIGFWPTSVYFPVEMYIKRKKIPKWSTKWLSLQTLRLACLVITIVAAAGYVAGIVHDISGSH